MGPKRKRSERGQDAGRPSPHRPAETPMGQRDRDNFDSPGRGRGGRNPRRNDRRDSTQNYSGQHGFPRSQRPTSPTTSRQAAPPQPAPSTATTNERQPPPSVAAPAPPPPASSYPYEILTDDKVAAWKDTARQSLIEHGVQSRQDVDVIELSNLFQEFIHSVVERRLSPSDAGSCVKEIVGPESKEIIKEGFSYEPHKLFLDSLTTVLDDQPDVYTPALRDFLVATEISPSLMRQVLDAPLLQKLGLIRDTFVKLGIRHSTNLLYRQANYNLLREESEGYSKLLTELFTSFAEAPSTEVPSTEVAQATFERIKALIGTFDLDVGRVLDVALDVCATSLVKASKFFVKLLRVSSWWPRRHVPTDAFFAGGLPLWASPRLDEEDQGTITELKHSRNVQFWDRARNKQMQAWFELGGKQVTNEGMKLPDYLHNSTGEETEAAKVWITTTQTLPPQGNRVAAQLLGFKLRYYASDYRDGEILPANLLYLAALLIKIGFISIVDLYPHLWPKDEQMEDFRDEKMKEVEAEERKKRGGGQPNALLMAGMLSEEDAPGARPGQLRDGNKLGAQASASTTDASEKSQAANKPLEQKGALVTSLLTVGAIPEALFLIGRWPWLTEAFPEIHDRVNRLLEHSIQKVWDESRPRAVGPMECPPKKMPDPDQSGMPKGTVKLSPMPIRKAMRWPYPDGRQGTGDQPYRFFWDDWADNVPVCQTVADVFTLCDTFMKVSGPNIGKSPKLMDKLLAIGEKSLAGDKSQENFDRWQDLLARLLVPALSTTSGSPNASEMLWSLLKLYPAPVRYGIYAEWFEGPMSRQPAMRTAFARTKAETQSVMKRVSNKNMTDSAKTLSKASHSSPGIVCRVALEQISSYANLTDAMVECCKYFTDLSKDVLVWSLLVALGSNQRSRTQASYILSVSAWLQALSGFTGKVFRRYKELDTTPILQYVNSQLFHGNSTDLIILEELTLSMGGIVKTLDITDEQVMAMSGMTLLQRHTLVSMRDNRFESTRSSKRLMQALIDSRLAGRLLINIAQFRQSSSFHLADDGAHVKFLSNMIDNSHQILLQYLDLLRFNLSPEEFDKLVPGIGQLMTDFGLDASLAFMIGRESLASHMFSKASPIDTKQKLSSQLSTDKDGDISMNEDAVITNGTPATETETPLADQKLDSPVAASGIFDALQPVIGSIQTSADSAISQKMSAEFFVIFWALQLGDILVPWDSYRIAQDRCELQWRQLVKDRSDMSKAGSEKREAQKAEVQAEMKALLIEGKQHSERVAKAKVHFTKRMSTWFPGPIERLGGISDAIIEQCLFPRLVVSKADTEYAYALIKQLHELSCPNFRLKALYDRLFNANRIRLMLFTCTVREAELFGRFFHHVLRDLASWHKDSSIYLREAVGKSDKKPQTRLGFADRFGVDGQPTSHIEHAQFRDDLFGWHKSLNVALKSCLAGTEWAHIRNAISFLTAINQFFPAVDFMGTQLYTQLEKVGEREEHSREDLSTLANGALSVLARRKASWVKVQAFRTNISAQDQKDQQPKTAPGSSLRADAPTFQPKPNANDEEDGEVQDGGKDHTTAAAAKPQRSASSQQDVPRATPNNVTQRDSPKPATSTPPTAPAASTPKSAASVPGPTNSTPRDVKQAAPSPAGQNKNTPRAPHNLPARPPGPIPESVPQGNRYGRDLRDVRDSRGSRERDTRDTRETRDPRDSRVDAARPDRGRELSTPEQRGPTRDVGGRAPEKGWPSPSTGRDHPLPARDPTATNERVHASSARTPEPNRTGREVAAPANASEPKVEEPRINPARAALIKGDTSERQDQSNRQDKSRVPDSDRRGGRSQQQPGPSQSEATAMNPERAARFNEGRPMRDDPRERPASRNISPRRNARAEPVADRPREEHPRSHYSEHRSHARDSRGDSNQGPHSRDDGHNTDSTRDAFLGSSRGPDVEHGRTRQDESYGRLNQTPTVDSQIDGPPSGPRGRGGRTGSRTNNVNMPSRFSHGEGPNSDMTDDRRPPTGPSSGRGRHPYGLGPTPGPDSTGPPGPPGPPADRARQTPSGPPSGQQSTSSPVPAGVHPDRLAQMSGVPQGQSPHQQQLPSSRGPPGISHNTREQPAANMSGSPASDPQVPTGPGGDRRRGGGGRRQLDGINSTLQQAQANMPDTSRVGTTTSRGRSNRQSLMGSDAQVLTGGSPVSTPSHERPNPMPPPDRESAGGDLSKGDPERRDRDRSQRSGRSSRRHSRDADRERERSPAREREAKEPREYRERHSGGPGHGFGTREERERESRRSARDQPGVGPRNPQPSAAQGSNSEPMGSREPRRRDDRIEAAGGGRSEDRNGGGMRGYPRSGPREGGSRPGEDRRNAPRDDRGRKRRSEDVSGFPSEKRMRH